MLLCDSHVTRTRHALPWTTLMTRDVNKKLGRGLGCQFELSDTGKGCRMGLSDDSRTPTDKLILVHFFSCSIVEFFNKDFSILLLA